MVNVITYIGLVFYVLCFGGGRKDSVDIRHASPYSQLVFHSLSRALLYSPVGSIHILKSNRQHDERHRFRALHVCLGGCQCV